MMFVLAGVAIVGGIVLALIDVPASSLAVIVIALAILALAFVWGKTQGQDAPSRPPDAVD
jgi:hypothetical protein